MRQIKFRVWNTFAKTYYPRAHFGLDLDGVEMQLMIACEHHREPFARNRAGGEAMVFEQFTGLLDKNGQEIFEGDCLGEEFESLHVGWCEKCGGFCLKAPIGASIDCFGCGGDIHWREFVEDPNKVIVGNIRENPELAALTPKGGDSS